MNKQPLTIAIAIPSYSGKLSLEVSVAIASNVHALAKQNINVEFHAVGKSHIHTARNSLIGSFLKNSKAEYLFFLDDDIAMPDNYLKNIIDVAQLNELFVVAGLYRQKDGQRSAKKFIKQPQGYNQYVSIDEFDYECSIQGYSVIQIDGTGLGGMLMHRHVLESVRHISGGHPCLRGNTKTDIGNGQQILMIEGEDICLCKHIQSVGYKIHCRTGVVLNHQRK